MIPIRRVAVIAVKMSKLPVSYGFNKLNMISISTDPKCILKANIPINKKTSPNLLIIKALNATLLTNTQIYQKLIKKYETNPTPSQPKNINRRLLDVTKRIIKNVKRDK
jgi:hypothetical protein